MLVVFYGSGAGLRLSSHPAAVQRAGSVPVIQALEVDELHIAPAGCGAAQRSRERRAKEQQPGSRSPVAQCVSRLLEPLQMHRSQGRAHLVYLTKV